MATQIFIEPELENLSDETIASEWFEICSELGLSEQLKHADRSEEKKAPQYMMVDPKTSRIIKTLCPRVVDYKNYEASTIPLDVLQEIQKCEKHGWYAKIFIAYDDKSPDPFVLGYCHGENWNRPIHLIARWGAELLPFEVLEAKAIQRISDEVKDILLDLKTKVEIGIGDVQHFSKMLLNGREIPRFDFTTPELSRWI